MFNLTEIFKKHGCVKIEGHGELYDRLLAPFADKEIKLLEIGVFQGNSLISWQEALPKAKIFGIDRGFPVGPCTKDLSFAEIIVGDQSYPPFVSMVAEKYGPFDVIIDDGGHWCDDQQVSFEGLWPAVRVGGFYVVEDLWVARERTLEGWKCTIDYLEELPYRKEFFPGYFGSEKLGNITHGNKCSALNNNRRNIQRNISGIFRTNIYSYF